MNKYNDKKEKPTHYIYVVISLKVGANVLQLKVTSHHATSTNNSVS